VAKIHVHFREPILASSFTASEVAISSPQGSLDPSSFTITQTDLSSFEVDFPVQSTEGDYTVSISSNVQDLSGNPLGGTGYQAMSTIDKTGPRATGTSLAGTLNARADHIDVTFDEPIVLASFTSATITFTGPHGTVAVGTPALVSGTTYRISF